MIHFTNEQYTKAFKKGKFKKKTIQNKPKYNIKTEVSKKAITQLKMQITKCKSVALAFKHFH